MSVVSENCTAEFGTCEHRCEACGASLVGRPCTVVPGKGDYCRVCIRAIAAMAALIHGPMLTRPMPRKGP